MTNSRLLRASLAGWLAWITMVAVAGETGLDILLHYGAKPLIVLSLAVYATLFRPSQASSRRWLWGALVFALIGDVCLMVKGIDLFLPGLGAFFFMQFCYTGLFLNHVRQHGQPLTATLYSLTIGAVVLYSTGVLDFLYPSFRADPAKSPLWPAIVLYIGNVTIMTISAAVWQQRVAPKRFPTVLAGALCYVLMNTLLSYNLFVQPFDTSPIVVTMTYTASQFLLITGFITATEPQFIPPHEA